ncbi:tripartite tricarboxylate transporter TctB family protein [Citricoccus sp. NPDC079358]|uniref:tripartite tricarboxylate transporter TctB family protein n=1 Tax=Citricoccus sp. NPDC079358 TaxID=3154653 RepID=UPI003450D0EC
MTAQSANRSAMPDLVISCVILVICGGAIAISITYPPSVSMLLPRLAAGLGLLCAAWIIISKSIALARQRLETGVEGTTGPVDDHTAVLKVPTEDDDEVDPNDAEYVLSHTSRRVWLTTIGFIAGFFLVLYLCGLFVAAAALSLVYLIVIGKKSWLFSLIYTAVLTGLLWVLMRWATYIPSPPGVLLPGG